MNQGGGIYDEQNGDAFQREQAAVSLLAGDSNNKGEAEDGDEAEDQSCSSKNTIKNSNVSTKSSIKNKNNMASQEETEFNLVLALVEMIQSHKDKEFAKSLWEKFLGAKPSGDDEGFRRCALFASLFPLTTLRGGLTVTDLTVKLEVGTLILRGSGKQQELLEQVMAHLVPTPPQEETSEQCSVNSLAEDRGSDLRASNGISEEDNPSSASNGQCAFWQWCCPLILPIISGVVALAKKTERNYYDYAEQNLEGSGDQNPDSLVNAGGSNRPSFTRDYDKPPASSVEMTECENVALNPREILIMAEAPVDKNENNDDKNQNQDERVEPCVDSLADDGGSNLCSPMSKGSDDDNPSDVTADSENGTQPREIVNPARVLETRTTCADQILILKALVYCEEHLPHQFYNMVPSIISLGDMCLAEEAVYFCQKEIFKLPSRGQILSTALTFASPDTMPPAPSFSTNSATDEDVPSE